jgi:hypothetical protein
VQQPIVGAHVYLFAANTTGYGQASVSMVSAAETGTSDSVGAYVAADALGFFDLTGDYACTSGQQLYIYTLGGTTGSQPAPSAGLMAAIGSCPSSSSAAIFATVNEVSTIAAAYALAGFATDATHVSSSGTSLAQVGVANAFANAGNLATLATGVALATTPAGNGTVPEAEINTLADILAECVEASASSNTLLSVTTADGTVTGTKAADTATAAINIAHHPGANVAALYELAGSPMFTPKLTAQPNDFTVGLNFSGAGYQALPSAIAIDSSGNAWIANFGDNSVTELSSAGVNLSGTNGFTGGGLNGPEGIAIDSSDNAWVTNGTGNSVTKLSSSGVPISPSSGYTGGALNGPRAIAVDGAGNAWIANFGNYLGNNVTELSSSGAVLSGPGGYTGGGLEGPVSIAIGASGTVWVTNPCFFPFNCNWPANLTELSSAGTALSGSMGYTGASASPWGVAVDASGNAWVTNYGSSVLKFSNSGSNLSGANGYTGGGLSLPQAIAVDGAGNIWVTNSSLSDSVTELSSSGIPLSTGTGYTGGSLDNPIGMAIDGSGDIWVANRGHCQTNSCNGNTYGLASITELVGAGTPVVTPLAAGGRTIRWGRGLRARRGDSLRNKRRSRVAR